ncbi:hypothetical protein RHGRI_023507 [Rhododendron griersonianum]|uniref:Glycine-rich protein n=1 Tax=Rhododendron griersonianum TaxID=479676 RepID=A0AAV6J5U9_9ERIC|nr:hypothetical protein RHGRI_023507 [Rhododendron griersonianum]
MTSLLCSEAIHIDSHSKVPSQTSDLAVAFSAVNSQTRNASSGYRGSNSVYRGRFPSRFGYRGGRFPYRGGGRGYGRNNFRPTGFNGGSGSGFVGDSSYSASGSGFAGNSSYDASGSASSGTLVSVTCCSVLNGQCDECADQFHDFLPFKDVQ